MGFNRASPNIDLNGDGIEGFENMSGGLSADGSPCIFISAEPEKLGQVTHCNMSLCKLFGYTNREAIIGHEVERLMPRIYAKQHKKFLEQAIQKPPELLSSKEKFIFGKHSTGYIFPIQLTIKNVPSFVSGRQFAATFRVEKPGINKNAAYLIMDKNNSLVDASSSCISMLDIDMQRYNRLKVKISMKNHLDALFGQNQYSFHNKLGSQIDYTFPKLLTNEEAAMEEKIANGIIVDDLAFDSIQDLDNEEGSSVPQYQSRNSKAAYTSNRPSKRFLPRHSETKALSLIDEEE